MNGIVHRLLMIVGRLFEVPIEDRSIAGTHANADIHVAVLSLCSLKQGKNKMKKLKLAMLAVDSGLKPEEHPARPTGSVSRAEGDVTVPHALFLDKKHISAQSAKLTTV